MIKKRKKKTADENTEKIFAFLCYFIPIVGIIIVLVTKNERTDFSIYHCKQGIVLIIAWIIVSIISSIMAIIPFFGWVVAGALLVFMLVIWIIGMVNSLTGKKVPLPVVGQFAKPFKF